MRRIHSSGPEGGPHGEGFEFGFAGRGGRRGGPERRGPGGHGSGGRGGGRGRGRGPEEGADAGLGGGRGPRGGRHGGPGGPRRGGRAQRGDVRAAVLLLLAEEPMHGYQLMQAIAEKTADAWRPSAGAIYPTLAQLEDEGLIETTEAGGRRSASLTAAGREHLAANAQSLGDPFAAFAQGPAGVDLRAPLRDLQIAARQIAMAGDTSQQQAAAAVLTTARRELYLLLAGEQPTQQ